MFGSVVRLLQINIPKVLYWTESRQLNVRIDKVSSNTLGLLMRGGNFIRTALYRQSAFQMEIEIRTS